MLKLSALLLSCGISSAFAAGELFYAFYNDVQCTEGEGTHVSSMNDGCLKQNGRLGVTTAGGSNLYYPVLVGYTDENCEEEIGCNAMPNQSHKCVDFTSQAWQWASKAKSFKFIAHPAEPGSCPTDCIGECPGGQAPTKRDVKALESGREGKDRVKREIEARQEAEAAVEAKKEIETRQAKAHDFAYCSNDDCTDCGTSIEPNGIDAHGDPCSIEGSRKSVYYSGGAIVVLSGYTTDDQTCKNDVTGTVRMDHEGCYPLKSGADGGPNAYQVTTFSSV